MMQTVAYTVRASSLELQERGERLLSEARRKAAEMGTRYLCHPANRVTRKWPFVAQENRK